VRRGTGSFIKWNRVAGIIRRSFHRPQECLPYWQSQGKTGISNRKLYMCVHGVGDWFPSQGKSRGVGWQLGGGEWLP